MQPATRLNTDNSDLLEAQINVRREAGINAAKLGLGTMDLSTTGDSQVFAAFKTWATIVRWVHAAGLSASEICARAPIELMARREFLALYPRDARDLTCKAWVMGRALDTYLDPAAPTMFCLDDRDDAASFFAADVAAMFPEIVAIARGEAA